MVDASPKRLLKLISDYRTEVKNEARISLITICEICFQVKQDMKSIEDKINNIEHMMSTFLGKLSGLEELHK